MIDSLKIDPFGFREYDARWIFEKDINLDGIKNLGKGLGTQIVKNTEKNTGLPATDVIRYGGEKIFNQLI